MFDSLSGKLQNAFRNLRGLGKISEANVSDALREVRLALLEADVNFKVARDFIERVKAKALGEEVVQSIQPGQQIIKIIHDELVDLLGSANAGPAAERQSELHPDGRPARLGQDHFQRQARPAAPQAGPHAVARGGGRLSPGGDGPARNARQTAGDARLRAQRGETDVLKIAREALDFARANNRNTLIFDTAGRLQIDEPLVQELVRLRDLVKPQEILLVLDAATGQEAVNVATHFDQALNITGSILTKLDGDARGGAALSLKAVTGKPIKFVGMGEKLEEFEPFHPERMASRILGMGDVVSLVEKAAEAVDLDDAKRMEEKMRKGQFTLEDFLEQLRQMKKLGSLESIVGMLPGGAEALKGADLSQAGKGIQAHGGDDLRHDAAGTAQSAHPQRQAPPAHRQRQRRDRDRAEHDAEQVRPDAADDEEDGQVPEDDGPDGRRRRRALEKITRQAQPPEECSRSNRL